MKDNSTSQMSKPSTQPTTAKKAVVPRKGKSD